MKSYTNKQFYNVIWSLILRILNFLNMRSVWALNSAKVIMRTAFFCIIEILSIYVFMFCPHIWEPYRKSPYIIPPPPPPEYTPPKIYR